MVTEESTKDTVKTIAQGMPAVAVYPVVADACAFCCTGGYGCNAHPAFPAPSSNFEGGSFPIPRAFRAARTRTRVSNHVAAHPSRRGLSAAPQDEVVTWGTQLVPRGEERGNAARLEPRGPRKR